MGKRNHFEIYQLCSFSQGLPSGETVPRAYPAGVLSEPNGHGGREISQLQPTPAILTHLGAAGLRIPREVHRPEAKLTERWKTPNHKTIELEGMTEHQADKVWKGTNDFS